MDNIDCTALIYACKNKMHDIALKLIKTGNSNIEYKNNCIAA